MDTASKAGRGMTAVTPATICCAVRSGPESNRVTLPRGPIRNLTCEPPTSMTSTRRGTLAFGIFAFMPRSITTVHRTHRQVVLPTQGFALRARRINIDLRTATEDGHDRSTTPAGPALAEGFRGGHRFGSSLHHPAGVGGR